jgi:hypothetical protein
MSNHLKISCCKASELIEKKNISTLSFYESIQLKIHGILCAGCKAYQKHSRILEDGIKKVKRKEQKSQTLSPKIKEEIISKL